MKQTARVRQAGVMSKADQSLWRGWRDAGDELAFQTLVEPHLRFAHDMARRWGCTDADADDVVQDALLRLAEEPTERPVEVGVRAWLGREISLRARMRRRSEGRRHARERKVGGWRRDAVDGEPSTPTETVEKELAALPDAWREAIVLRYLHDLEYADLARILGVSETACRVRVHRGIARLRARLGVGAGALVAALPFLGPAVPTVEAGSLSASGMGLSLLGVLAMPKVLAVVLGAGAIGLALAIAPLLDQLGPAPIDHLPAERVEARVDPESLSEPRDRGLLRGRSSPRSGPTSASDPEVPKAAAPTRAASPAEVRTVLEQIYANGGKAAVDGTTPEGATTPDLVWLDDPKAVGRRPVTGVEAGVGDRLRWFSLLSTLPALRHLGLAETALRRGDLLELPAFPDLHTLLVQNTLIGGGDVHALVDFPKLERLDLSGCPILKADLGRLAPLPLRELSLRGTPLDQPEALGKLKGLRVLDLAGTPFSDDDLRAIAHLTTLETLILENARKLEQVRYLPYEGLRRIVLRGAGLEDRSVRWPKTLEVVDVSKTAAGRRVFDSLDRLKALAEADFSETSLDDRGLERHLRTVMRRTKLRRLVVTGSKVTAEMVGKLKKKYPTLEIIR